MIREEVQPNRLSQTKIAFFDLGGSIFCCSIAWCAKQLK